MNMLRLGIANLSEVAELAGVSRQAASWWAMTDGVDWRAERKTRLEREWEKQVSKSSVGPSGLAGNLGDLPPLRRGEK